MLMDRLPVGFVRHTGYSRGPWVLNSYALIRRDGESGPCLNGEKSSPHEPGLLVPFLLWRDQDRPNQFGMVMLPTCRDLQSGSK